MYSLDLKTLISILQTHAQTGLLHANLSRGIVEHADTASATITVVKGELVSCAIKDQDGLPYALGEQAYQLLARISSLEWTLKLQLASSLLPPPPSLRADVREQVVPRCLREPQAAQHTKWTRTQRLVFAMIDGKKSVGEIARFLSLSPSLVHQALFDLYQMNLLALDPSQGNRETARVSPTRRGA